MESDLSYNVPDPITTGHNSIQVMTVQSSVEMAKDSEHFNGPKNYFVLCLKLAQILKTGIFTVPTQVSPFMAYKD